MLVHQRPVTNLEWHETNCFGIPCFRIIVGFEFAMIMSYDNPTGYYNKNILKIWSDMHGNHYFRITLGS